MNWKDYHNKHKGETGVVICNGPSLKEVPNDWLSKYPTFGTNRIYLKGFTPTYYVAVNPLVIGQSIKEIEGLDCVKFLPEQWKIGIPLRSVPVPMFSICPDIYIYEGHTVTFVCLQIAYYMDFDTILLVGLDHRYKFTGASNEELVGDGPDINHFHPDYFGKGIHWNAPDLEKSEEAYKLAKAVYTDDKKRIINLTPNTALKIFEKGNIQQW